MEKQQKPFTILSAALLEASASKTIIAYIQSSSFCNFLIVLSEQNLRNGFPNPWLGTASSTAI